jgi:diphthine-ammonia ligase
MKLGVLFSGGKDSAYAIYKSMHCNHEISCLITLQSDNEESYMFHTANINLTQLQSEAMGIPLIIVKTQGEKEKELIDLKNAIKKAKQLFKITGIATGAIESVYQATRIQKICDELGLWCFNPLWQKDQVELLNKLLENKFEVIIAGVFAYPFDKTWLGRKLDKKMIAELENLREKYKINPSGEGGELESFVLNAPFFKKKIVIKKSRMTYSNHSGVYKIEEACLL